MEACAGFVVGLEAVSEVEASEVDLLGMRQPVEQDVISRIRIFTRIIPVLINRHRLRPLVQV